VLQLLVLLLENDGKLKTRIWMFSRESDLHVSHYQKDEFDGFGTREFH